MIIFSHSSLIEHGKISPFCYKICAKDNFRPVLATCFPGFSFVLPPRHTYFCSKDKSRQGIAFNSSILRHLFSSKASHSFLGAHTCCFKDKSRPDMPFSFFFPLLYSAKNPCCYFFVDDFLHLIEGLTKQLSKSLKTSSFSSFPKIFAHCFVRPPF